MDLMHYGIKGQKWGVRRYQNKDGSLTKQGIKKYRKRYDNIAQQKQMAIKSKKSIGGLYNYDIYMKRADTLTKGLIKKIGNKGMSQLDQEVMKEARIAGKKAVDEALKFNKSFDSSVGDMYLFLKNPEREYKYAYDKYTNERLVKR